MLSYRFLQLLIFVQANDFMRGMIPPPFSLLMEWWLSDLTGKVAYVVVQVVVESLIDIH